MLTCCVPGSVIGAVDTRPACPSRASLCIFYVLYSIFFSCLRRCLFSFQINPHVLSDSNIPSSAFFSISSGLSQINLPKSSTACIPRVPVTLKYFFIPDIVKFLKFRFSKRLLLILGFQFQKLSPSSHIRNLGELSLTLPRPHF